MLEIFYLGSAFFALLTIYLLLFKEGAIRSYADYILAIYFIFQVWCIVIYLLVYSGLINNMPHLYKTAGPISFVTPALVYLYVRAVLYNQRISIKDWPHFIPFIIIFFNYLPFYSMPINEKSSMVANIVNDISNTYKFQIGIIPEYLIYILLPLLVTFYVFIQWKLILNYKITNLEPIFQKQIDAVVKWLKINTWASTFFVIGYILLIIGANTIPHFFATSISKIIISLSLALAFFVISVHLLVHQNVLLGLPFVKYKEANLFVKDNYAKEIATINSYFIENQPFLINNLTIAQLSVMLSMSPKELSYIINNYYEVRFSDFLNKFRVEYITNKFNEIYLNNYTIESLAKESGFSSMPSFYRAFNKIHNCTPSEFLNTYNADVINR